MRNEKFELCAVRRTLIEDRENQCKSSNSPNQSFFRIKTLVGEVPLAVTSFNLTMVYAPCIGEGTNIDLECGVNNVNR